MEKCDFCKYRHSWECDDELPYPKNGCKDFSLDEDTLTEEEKRMIMIFNIMKGE